MGDAVLLMYTIYDHPADYPNGWPVREFSVGAAQGPEPQAGQVHGVFNTLDDARQYVGDYADTCIPRSPEDDPTIVETWV